MSGCRAGRASRRLWRAAVAVALAAALAPAARAFGGEGHRLIATLAEQRLTDRARAEVRALLALEPGATLVSISTWADDTRSASTAGWHYVNFPRDADCRYDAARDCPDGQCVVGAIERQRVILSSAATDTERLNALKYIVHFVADVHQPLHAGFADDRGGNRYQVQAFGRGTNLHALWDSVLVERWPAGPAALAAELKSSAAVIADSSLASQWAEESCRIVSKDGFYPSGHKVEVDYVQRVAPVLKERLTSAARRLAGLLNRAFGDR